MMSHDRSEKQPKRDRLKRKPIGDHRVSDAQSPSCASVSVSATSSHTLNSQLSVGTYQRRLAECHQLLQDQPEDYQAWYNQGDALANLGDCEQALVSFDRALELQPHSIEALTFRAAMLIRLKRYEEALSTSNQALRLQPNDSEAWIFRGAALRSLGHFKEAYASYDRALGIERISLWQRLRQALKKLLRFFRR